MSPTNTPRRMTVAVKPVSESKTVWVGAVTMILGVLVWFGAISSDTTTPEHVEAITGTVLTLVGVVNTVLRLWFTKSPLTTNKDA